MSVYINGIGNISPQQSWNDIDFLNSPVDYVGNQLRCIEPDYVTLIDPKSIRRMSRIIKMGVAAGKLALQRAGVTVPDGIITGTGFGCQNDTATFLSKIVELKEEALNPTPFIQSTHNTIGSQIALLLQCQAYNQTYAHGAFSFEAALLDALLRLEEHPQESLLVGGVDEIIDLSHYVLLRLGSLKLESQSSLRLFKEEPSGVLNGEGAAFFVLSGERKSNSLAAIDGLTTLYKPDETTLGDQLEKFLYSQNVKKADIDLVLLGKSGFESGDVVMDRLIDELCPTSSKGCFKHLCGESPVATAFAVWLGAKILQNQDIPSLVLDADKSRKPGKVLTVNRYFSDHFSFVLMSRC